ncbi:MAG: acyltransferase family protein [Bacillota bacterium]
MADTDTAELVCDKGKADAIARRAAGDVGLAHAEVDAIKGFLIVAIVAGHNTLLTGNIRNLFDVLYSFHVYGFLLLPFLFAAKPLSGRSIADRAVRYLVPYAVFYMAASVLYLVMYRRADAISAWGWDVVAGLAVASPTMLQKASGFQLFWFLPTLFSLTLFWSVYSGLNTRARVAVFAVLCLLQPAVVAVAWARYVPFGMAIVVHVAPMGMVAAWLWTRYLSRRPGTVAVVFGAAFVMMVTVMLWLGGSVDIYGKKSPGVLLVHQTTAMVAFLAILGLGPVFGKTGILVALGKASMLIYLMHSMVYQACLQVSGKVGLMQRFAGSGVMLGLVFLVVSLLVCMGVKYLIDAIPVLRRTICPRGVEEWTVTARLGKR